MRLATKILTVSLTFIVLLTAVAGYVSVRRVQDDFNQAQSEFAQQYTDTISNEILTTWQAKGPAGVNQYLREVTETSKGSLQIKLYVLDPTDITLVPARRPLEELLKNPIDNPITDIGNDEQGHPQLYVYVPFDLETGQRGALEFTISLASITKQMWQRVWLTIAAIGTLAVVSVLTAYLTGVLWVIRPLHKLADKTERIGKGDFGGPLILESNDELSELAEALNRMCVQLDRQKRTIAEESQKRLTMLEQLRHSDRLQTVGRLAAGVGHELGTPLNVISGRAGLICSGRLDAEKIQESARVIKTETERITGIVRQLLDFARPRPPQRKQVDLHEILRHTIHLLEPLADKQQIEIRPPIAAAQDPPALALADAGQLQQVFTNIIVNAIQAISAEGQSHPLVSTTASTPAAPSFAAPGESPSTRTTHARIEIDLSTARLDAETSPTDAEGNGTVRSMPSGLYWCVTIGDSGPGVPEGLLPHIFEPFFTTKDVGVGTGLGLSIVHGIVQEHGGRIEVSNRESGGACFRVYLPRESQ